MGDLSGQRIPRAQGHQRRLPTRLTLAGLALAGLALVVGVALGAGQAALEDEAATGFEVSGLQTPGAVDVGFFIQDMIVHHQQAITMVDAIGGRVGARVRPVAHTIRTEQLGEIGMMSGQLAVWGAPPLSSATPMAWMTGHGMHAGDVMPGMATPAELDTLTRLRGRAVATLFLQLMIRHHEGGIAMATYASENASTDVVRSAAERMILDERQEISLMTQLLAMV